MIILLQVVLSIAGISINMCTYIHTHKWVQYQYIFKSSKSFLKFNLLDRLILCKISLCTYVSINFSQNFSHIHYLSFSFYFESMYLKHILIFLNLLYNAIFIIIESPFYNLIRFLLNSILWDNSIINFFSACYICFFKKFIYVYIYINIYGYIYTYIKMYLFSFDF